MIEKICSLLSSARVDLSDEKRTQADIESILRASEIPFDREFRLSPGDIPDFMINGIAVEVKIRGARKKDVFKQLSRYAKHDCVRAVVLVTNLSMGLPQIIEEKPAYFIPLGKAWL